MHPLPGEVHLAKLVNDVIAVAERSLSLASKELRTRKEIPDVAIKGTDVPSLVREANTSINDLVQILRGNLRADREELDVLWWVFGGRSTQTGHRFDAMREGERALAAATELSDRMLMPPISAASHLLSSLVPDAPELSATQLVAQLSKDALSAFLLQRDAVAPVLNAHPALLPMTWLSARLLDSDLSPGWQHEFERKTQIKSDSARSPTRWAHQLFDELVARRLCVAVEERGEDVA
jgi:hypothetical protein